MEELRRLDHAETERKVMVNSHMQGRLAVREE